MKRLLLPAAVLALAGCPREPETNARIEVSPRAAARANLIGSRASTVGAGARVHPLAPGQELGGPNATGHPGDWVIENDEVVFVIDALGGGAGFAESGGNVVDAADAVSRKDELGQVMTYFGTFPRQAVYTAIDARVLPDGTAVVEARGRELLEPAIEVTTEYRLAKTDRALLLRSTLVNRSAAPLKVDLGDAIMWGGAEKFAPGKALGFRGPVKAAFIGGIGRHASYAITGTDGEVEADSGGGWTDTTQQRGVVLAPGVKTTYERVLLVGQRPDVASLVAELAKASGGEVGAIEVSLVDAKGAPVTAPIGAKVVVGTDAGDVMTLVATRDGVLAGEVPPGRWLLSYAPSAGRRGNGARVAVDVARGGVAKATLVVTEPSSMTLGPCVEAGRPLPCKLTIEGKAPTVTPDLGPAHLAGIAKNVVTLRPNEALAVPLPFGTYKVTASRGPEYDVATLEVTVPSPPTSPIALRRVVDTTGYVATDFHQHTILSADAPVATRDRVLANAAEGVEVAVASEHNVVADLSPVVKELGLEGHLLEVPGDELSSDASRAPFGHANLFPLVPAPDRPRGGAIAVRDRLASDVFADARKVTGAVLQINHPRSGTNGYFDRLKFDPKTGVGTEPGYDPRFDALEVWNGRSVEHRTRVLDDFFALLRTSHPVTPVADTDTHGVVGEEPGYPRTYVRVTDDAVNGARVPEVVTGVRAARDVVLSNGPFLRVTGATLGGVMRPGEVKVSVATAPWVVVDRAELRFASGAAPAAVRLTPSPNGKGALVATATFAVRPKADDAFTVIVSGTKPMRPVIAGPDADIAPWAMSAPIWVDVDGDGKALGR